MIRSLAEKLLRNRRIRRTLPNGLPLYVSPDSQLKYLRSELDADLTALARDHVTADSAVWDIGANCGVFAFSAAGARQIVAVEADPFLADLLQQSAALNNVPVAIVTAAAWSSRSLASFAIAARGRASNHLVGAGNSQTGGERGRIIVPTVTLDDLLDHFGPPTLVKIDVEGAEIDVLAGASRLLADARPLIYIEVAPDNEGRAAAIFAAANYRLTKVSVIDWLAEPG